MDAAALSALISASSAELAALHAQLGSDPDEVEKAMVALKTCIHDAVHAQVQLVQADVTRVAEQCAAYQRTIEDLCKATGASCDPVAARDTPLLAHSARLQDEQARLERVYTAQREQCELVLEQITTLDACMSHAAGDIPPPGPAHGGWADVSPARLAQLEQHWEHVQHVYTARKMQLETQLTEIVQLWSELHVMPRVDVHGTRVGLALDAPADESALHWAILRYTRQVPLVDHGAFTGEFGPMDDAAACADESAAAPLLQPTDERLAQIEALRDALEQEKTRRETTIQVTYDELCELWMRFDVPEAEMDAFVLDHRGSTLDVVNAYTEELEKMRALKTQHMALFIAKTREQIAAHWDALFMSETERHASFPAYFLPLPATDAEPAGGFDWDHVLAQHEQMCARLAEMLEQRAPLLALIGRYREICQEAHALEASAQDGSRLLGRNNRGDPGRLLREEKMRKRVKIQKPKVEQELLRIIPAWEAEHGMPFLMDGARYVDYLHEQLGEAKENAKGARVRPHAATEGLASSRSANTAPATPHVPSKQPAAVRPASRAAPPRPASRAAPARPQSRAAPVRPASRAAPASARQPVARTRPAYAAPPRTPSAHTASSSDETTIEAAEYTQRTPSMLLQSSLARKPTPSAAHW